MSNSYDPYSDSGPTSKPVHPLERKPPPPPETPAQENVRRVRVIFKQSPPIVTYVLLVVNALVFLADALVFHGRLTDLGAKTNSGLMAGEFWRLITPMFLHVDLNHIGSNSIALIILGPMVERFYGHSRFAAIYFLAGIAGSVAGFAFGQTYVNDQGMLIPVASLGASGAITGLLGAAIALVYRNWGILVNLRRTTPLLIEMVISIILSSLNPNVDYLGHFGGLALGLLAGWLVVPIFAISMDIDGSIRVNDTSDWQSSWVVAVIAAVMLGGATLMIILLRNAHVLTS